MEIAWITFEIKRKVIEQHTECLYPYLRKLSQGSLPQNGLLLYNHFSTIGILGMHEAMLNLLEKGLNEESNREFGVVHPIIHA